MPYDVIYRYNEALDRRALTSLGTSLNALNAAVGDCEQAGRSIERDPAILLLARHLGEVAKAQAPDKPALEAACRATWARTVEHPALLALRGQHLGHQPRAKTTFHYQARRALLALADALALDPQLTRGGSRMGGVGDSGDSFLDHAGLYVSVVPWSPSADHEIGYYRRRNRADAGFPMHHAALPVLLETARLARDIGAVFGPDDDVAALAAAA